MLGRLDRNVIGNSVGRIGPEIRRDLLRRAEADVKIVGDRLRIEAELQRPRPIDVGHEGGCIELLLEVCVSDAWNGGHTAAKLVRHPHVRGAVAADHASIDLCGQAEIEDLGGHVGGLEIEGY